MNELVYSSKLLILEVQTMLKRVNSNKLDYLNRNPGLLIKRGLHSHICLKIQTAMLLELFSLAAEISGSQTEDLFL